MGNTPELNTTVARGSVVIADSRTLTPEWGKGMEWRHIVQQQQQQWWWCSIAGFRGDLRMKGEMA